MQILSEYCGIASLHNKLGVQAPIYEVAGEAYLRLQLFGDAETVY